MTELKPCPFCNKQLIHTNGKRVNRYYKGEPTIYKHFPEGCILDGLQITEKTLDKWNTRKSAIEAWNRRVDNAE